MADVEGQATVHINAAPEKVYALISDVTRYPEWSPEQVKTEWVGDAKGPAVGAKFKGHNKLGILRWSRSATVKAADPGKEFTFETPETRWSYKLSPAGGGTDVTESFETLKYGLFSKLTAPPKKRAPKLEGDVQKTLERIKAAVEGSA
ncbi:MAG: SRPBCC family protein [Actinobacteria bacterium]|nr:SRPBCC family protein [Actinomycetota bacterium]